VGLPVSLILIAVGAILAFAVHHDPNAAVNVHAVGWVLMIVGLVGLLLSLLWWERWGPGYWSRRSVVYDDAAGGPYDAATAGTYRRAWGGYGRRRRVIEEDAGPGPAGPYTDAPPPP
jgi:hypothetical protein